MSDSNVNLATKTFVEIRRKKEETTVFHRKKSSKTPRKQLK